MTPICNPAQHFTVTTDGALSAEVVADADNCTAIVVRFAVDGAPAFESEGVAPGASTGVAELGPVTAGTHTLSVEADVPISFSCDFRAWSGTLAVTTSGVAATDVAFAATRGRRDGLDGGARFPAPGRHHGDAHPQRHGDGYCAVLGVRHTPGCRRC